MGVVKRSVIVADRESRVDVVERICTTYYKRSHTKSNEYRRCVRVWTNRKTDDFGFRDDINTVIDSCTYVLPEVRWSTGSIRIREK